MKILHVHEKGTWPFGGGEKYLSGACDDLEKLGHEIVIISSSTWLRNNLALLAQTSQSDMRGLEDSIQEYLRVTHDPNKSSLLDGALEGELQSRNANRREYLVAACPGFGSGARVINEVRTIIRRENPDVVNLHGIVNFLNPFVVRVLHRLKPTIQFVHYVGPLCLNERKILAHQNRICDLPMGLNCFKKRCLSGSMRGFMHNTDSTGLNHARERAPFGLAGKFIRKIRDVRVKFRGLEAIRRLDRIIVGSNYMRNQLLKNGFSDEKIVVIPCYTDKVSATSESLTNENMILFVGRLIRTKGIYQLIESLNLIRDREWQANIVGDGDEMNGAIHLVKRLGLDGKIHFAGRTPFEMVDAYYERCALVVMPSMMPESFGLVGIEAMAFGKPVVAFNVGGVTEWLAHNETGFLVERGNVHELADRIAQLLDNEALAAKLGSAGQRQVERHFRKDNHISGLMQVYKEAIEQRRLMDCPVVS